MAAEDMGFTAPKAPVAPPSDFRVVVIGAGVSGMLAAIRLAEAGIDHVVLEKNTDVGGTLAGERLPRRGRRHPEPPLLLLVRPAALVHPLRQARRGAHLPARRGRRPRPARGHPVRHRGGERGLPRPALDRHHRRGRDAHRGRRDHRRRTAQPAEDPTAAGPGRVPGPAVPLGALARGPRRHRQTGGGRRHRGERDADRARDRRAGRARHRVPALAAVGRAQRRVLLPHRRRRVAAHGARAVLPALVPHAAVVEHGRPGARLPAEGPPVGARRPFGQRGQRRAPSGVHPVRGERARRAGRPGREGAAGLPAVRQADAARQRLVRGAPPRRRRPRHRARRRGHADGRAGAGRHRDRGRRRGAVHGVRGPEAAVAVVDHAAGTG